LENTPVPEYNDFSFVWPRNSPSAADLTSCPSFCNSIVLSVMSSRLELLEVSLWNVRGWRWLALWSVTSLYAYTSPCFTKSETEADLWINWTANIILSHFFDYLDSLRILIPIASLTGASPKTEEHLGSWAVSFYQKQFPLFRIRERHSRSTLCTLESIVVNEWSILSCGWSWELAKCDVSWFGCVLALPF
jgi:hypothetical protein